MSIARVDRTMRDTRAFAQKQGKAATKRAEAARVPLVESASHEHGLTSLVLAEPPSANRWWRNVNGRMVLSREAREYKARVSAVVMAARIPKFAAPTTVAVELYWHRSRKAGDLDKRLGVLFDALQGTAYENDSQITTIEAHRLDWPQSPRVVVRIREAHAVVSQ